MSSETRPARLDPASPQNAVLLLVDQQEGLFSKVHGAEQTRCNLLALARSARLLGVPAVLTTALAAGPNGPQLKELTQTFAGQNIIDRTLINAWHDSRVHDAIIHTGRRKVIIAGTGLDVCAQLPALASAAEGYDPYVAIDACGRFEPVGLEYTIVGGDLRLPVAAWSCQAAIWYSCVSPPRTCFRRIRYSARLIFGGRV
jgi:nicotinamidase-related amidase